MNTLKEYTITNSLSIIEEKVTTQISKIDKDVLVRIRLNSDEYNIKKSKDYATIWFENVYSGNSIHWRIDSNKLYAYINAQVSPSGYIGTVVIEYNFKNNIFNLNNISFTVTD